MNLTKRVRIYGNSGYSLNKPKTKNKYKLFWTLLFRVSSPLTIFGTSFVGLGAHTVIMRISSDRLALRVKSIEMAGAQVWFKLLVNAPRSERERKLAGFLALKMIASEITSPPETTKTAA